MSNHLFDAMRAAAPGNAPFIRIDSTRTWTYDDAFALSGRIASAMDTLGIRPGDRVAVQVEKSAEALILYLACLRSGAVYLPLNTAYTLAELDYFIGDAEPRLVVVASAARAGVETIAK
ncbi:AMP-binding protein, partial [Rhizobium ruizarguesonis]